VFYATGANDVSFDGPGRNSFFASALIKTLAVPGLDIGDVFDRVAESVVKATGGKQTPELSRSAGAKFIFNRGETDRDVWQQLRLGADYSDKAKLQDFIARFPNSDFHQAAQDRITLLDIQAQQRARSLADAAAERERIAREAAEDAEQKKREQLAAEQRAASDKEAWARLEEEQKRRDAEQAARASAMQAQLAQLQQQKREAEERAARELAERQRLEQQQALWEQQQAQRDREFAALSRRSNFTEGPLAGDATPAAAQTRLASLDTTATAADQNGVGRSLPDQPSKTGGLSPRVHKELVIRAQLALGRLGCYGGPADGDFDKDTQGALSQYRKKLGIDDLPVPVSEEMVREIEDHDARICSLAVGKDKARETATPSKPVEHERARKPRIARERPRPAAVPAPHRAQAAAAPAAAAPEAAPPKKRFGGISGISF
jgi:peptidoglycan hydrolase-like protein with peptidoglycan-binding domain